MEKKSFDIGHLESLAPSPVAIFWLLVLVCLAVYGMTFVSGWTYDDYPVIVNNPDIRGWQAFLRDVYPGRPMRELTYLLDHALFGWKPGGWHLQQILWHVYSSWLLYLVARLLGIKGWLAWSAAFFFAVHPIQVESVANLSHRKELLAQSFGLSAFYVYLRSSAWTGRRKWAALAGCLVLFQLTLLSNQTAVSFMFLPLLYEWLIVRRFQASSWKARGLIIGLLLACLALFVAAYFSRYSFQQELFTLYAQNGALTDGSIRPLWGGVCKTFLLYIGKILFPVGLTPEYSVALVSGWPEVGEVIGAIMLLGALAAVWYCRWRAPLCSFGVGWFLCLYLPIAGFLPVGAYLMADRYMYMPLAGFALATVVLLGKIPGRHNAAMAVVLVLVLGALAAKQTLYWRSNDALWAHAVEVNPESTGVLWSYNEVLQKQGRHEESREALEKIIAINRFFMPAYLALGETEAALGNLPKAIERLDFYVRYGPMVNARNIDKARSKLKILKRLQHAR